MAGYREDDVVPSTEPLICDVASFSELHWQNGVIGEFKIPCFYVLEDETHQPIHLRAEGYSDPVVAFADPPAGLTGSAWIDEDDDALIHCKISALCPSATEIDEACGVAVLITRTDAEGPHTDAVIRGQLTVVAAPFVIPPPPPPEPPTPTELDELRIEMSGLLRASSEMLAGAFGYGVMTDFAGYVENNTLYMTAGSAMVNGLFFRVGYGGTPVDLTGLNGMNRIVLRLLDDEFSLVAIPIDYVLTKDDDLFEISIATIFKSLLMMWDPPEFAYEVAGTLLDPVGSYKSFAIETVPMSHLVANGGEAEKAIYPRLFAKVGTIYGPGTETTFTLPDKCGKVEVAFDENNAAFNSLTSHGGAEKHALSVGELAPHKHKASDNVNKEIITSNDGSNGTGPDTGSHDYRYLSSIDTGSTGSGTAHENMPPYGVSVVCIRA